MIKYLTPIILLTISNVFMTFAWYGHLRHKNSALWVVILVSWLIAFFEYCFQVPANRFGHEVYNVVQLKTIQEVITLIIFSLFSVSKIVVVTPLEGPSSKVKKTLLFSDLYILAMLFFPSSSIHL